MGLERILHAAQHRLRMPFRRDFGDDLDVRVVLDGFLKALVAFYAVDGAERALEIDDRGRLVADQSDETPSGMQTVGSGISADMGVDGARIRWRLVDCDERNAGRMGALDVLQNSLVVPRDRDDAVHLLGDAGVDL